MNELDLRISLRPVEPDDEDFLCDVYGSTRAAELAMTPWDEEQRAAFVRFQFAAQQQYYKSEYPRAEHHIVTVADEPIGRIYIDRRGEEIRILDLTILPGGRSEDVGASLLKNLMAEAEPERPLTIHLDVFSPARDLFTRLGFVSVSENGMHTLYEWRPRRLG